MFTKDKNTKEKPSLNNPAKQNTQERKNRDSQIREEKENRQNKSDMRSEGGTN